MLIKYNKLHAIAANLHVNITAQLSMGVYTRQLPGFTHHIGAHIVIVRHDLERTTSVVRSTSEPRHACHW